jgi:hypothetical protein
VDRVNTVHQNYSAVQEVKDYILKRGNTSDSLVHRDYSELFNVVDLANRRFYKVNDHHRIENWKSKILLSAIRMGIFNCWSRWSVGTRESWKLFRENLAEELVNQFKNES